ncbi:alpha/beta hydrolase family protein [Nocardiopsis composta]
MNNWSAYMGAPDAPAQEADLPTRSPTARGSEITTPLPPAHGTNDARAIRAESDGIAASLHARSIPVGYLAADNEGHGFSNPENEFRLQPTAEEHSTRRLGDTAVSATSGRDHAPRSKRCHRTIPACAGSRPIFPALSAASWDHPRVRGEEPSGT